MNARCWWCGAPADSGEHKFAAAELRLTLGRGPWIGDSAVVHWGAELGTRDVQGAKSDVLKWPKNLCQNCNNARSQPFDRAYMTFLQYLAQHETEVGASGVLRLSDVFGCEWREHRRNLIKYWVKHICCRADVIGLSIPDAVRAYLDGDGDGDAPPHTALVLLVNDSIFRVRTKHGYRLGSGFGDAEGYNRDGALVAFESYVTWGWLAVRYRFDISESTGWTSFPDDLVVMEHVAADDR